MKFSLMYKIGFALNVNFWHYNDPEAFGLLHLFEERAK